MWLGSFPDLLLQTGDWRLRFNHPWHTTPRNPTADGASEGCGNQTGCVWKIYAFQRNPRIYFHIFCDNKECGLKAHSSQRLWLWHRFLFVWVYPGTSLDPMILGSSLALAICYWACMRSFMSPTKLVCFSLNHWMKHTEITQHGYKQRVSHSTDTMNHGWIRETQIPTLSMSSFVPQDTTIEFMSISLVLQLFDCFEPNIFMKFFLLGAGNRVSLPKPGWPWTLELVAIILHLPTKYWDFRHVPLCSAPHNSLFSCALMTEIFGSSEITGRGKKPFCSPMSILCLLTSGAAEQTAVQQPWLLTQHHTGNASWHWAELLPVPFFFFI